MKKLVKQITSSINHFFKSNMFLGFFIIGSTFNGFLVRALTIGNVFAIRPILADLTITILIGATSLFFKKKAQTTYLLIWIIISSIFCFGNAIYYNYYNSFVSITFLSMIFVNIDTGGTNVTANIVNLKMLVLLLYPIIMLVLTRYLSKKDNPYKKGQAIRVRKKLFLSSIVVLIIFLCTLKPIDYSRFYKQWNREYNVSKFGLYAYQINDIVRSFEPTISELLNYDRAYLNFKNYYKDNNSKVTTNEYTNIYEGKNVLVIHAESMQQIAMNTKFNGKEVTPVLNRLASEGMYFSNFYSQVSVGTSSDSEFTFSTSLMPVNVGSTFIYHASKEYVSLPKLLKGKGYYTFSMHGNDGNFWNRKTMHANLGYDMFYDEEYYTYDETEKIGFGISDEEFFKQSVKMIKNISNTNTPFYGTIITLSNHTPFAELDKYGEFDVSITKNGTKYPYMEGTKLGNYFKSTHYADQQLGLFIELLDKEGLLDNTVIMLYGDHDARISKAEYNRLINYNYETDDVLDINDPAYQELDYYWYELNRKVPFIIWSKDTKYTKEVSKVMGMIDVMPTISNMLGINNPYALGHDIFDIKDNIVVFPNGNWVTEKVYYNDGKEEYKLLTTDALNENYIETYKKYTEKLLTVSNDTIIYNLIKKDLNKERYDEE